MDDGDAPLTPTANPAGIVGGEEHMLYLIEVLNPDGTLSHAGFGTGGMALLVPARSMREAHDLAMAWAAPAVRDILAPWGEPANGRCSLRARTTQTIGGAP